MSPLAEEQRERRRAYMRRYYLEHPEKWAESFERRRLDPKHIANRKRWNRKWAERHPEQLKVIRRQGQLRAYNLSIADYDAMLVAQGRLCLICGTTAIAREFAVDHDHKTGRVRGLLCSGCNVALGNMKDDPRRLRAAAAYIEASL